MSADTLRSIARFLESLGPTSALTQDLLLTRAAVVFRLATWTRTSDVTRIPRGLIRARSESMTFTIVSPKQRRPSAPHAEVTVFRVPGLLDPCEHIVRLLELFPDCDSLFPTDERGLASRVASVLDRVEPPPGSLTPHCLRHLGASAAVALGFGLDVVAAHGQWADPSTLLRFYAQGWTVTKPKPQHVSMSAFCI